MWVATDGGTQVWEALARRFSARAEDAFARPPRSTPLGSEADQSIGDIFRARGTNKLQKPCKTSGWTAVCVLRGVSIRKKIIGHRMCAIAAGLGVGKHLRRPAGTISLLQKPSRQHGGGVLFHPLIDQRGNFLAQVRGVCQTRQFKTLQGVPRSREKELPRWLGRAAGHMASDRERREH
jgi:hypothetical protein